MRILYFAWLKSRLGVAEETVSPPPDVRDVAALTAWLRTRGPAWAEAFSAGVVKTAVNQRYVTPSDPVGPDDEVAFFPPVTGG